MNASLFAKIPGIAATAVTLLCVGNAALAAGGAVQRPLADFLDVQGTYCIDDGAGGCVHFIDDDPNFLGWTSWIDDSSLYFAGIDYAGLVTEAYAPGQLPKITGTVTERPLKDGSAEVTVNLHTRGANEWVMVYDLTDPSDQLNDNPTVFGQRPDDVANGQALADVHLRAVFTIAYPGAPLPDLIEFNLGRPGLRTIAISSSASGPLTEAFGVEEGTPGHATVVETGLLARGKSRGKWTADGFPVEMINLKVVGN